MSDAIGIPDKEKFSELPQVNKPERVMFAIDMHYANRAGKHYDIRIQSPENAEEVYSFATKERFPEPGESTTVFMQPIHSKDAIDFDGEIGEGYGKGSVKKIRKEIAEIIKSSPEQLKFNLYPGRKTQEYNFIKIDDNVYKLINSTPSIRRGYEKPLDKPAMKQVRLKELDLTRDQYMAPKINGAHAIIRLDKDKPIRVMSHRISADGDIIDHTYKIDGLREYLKTPKELSDSILRAEIFAVGEDGNAVGPEVVAGLLNSNVLKSIDTQKKSKVRLMLAPFSVSKYNGREPASRKEEIDLLTKIVNSLPDSIVPMPFVKDPVDKKQMLKDIAEGNEPLTSEGVILDGKYKVKFTNEYDVKITDILPPKARDDMSSGFMYNEVDGKKISYPGKVGSGLSYELKKKMKSNPDLYRGLVAVVEGERLSDNGIIQKPVFKNFHLDKNDPDALEETG